MDLSEYKRGGKVRRKKVIKQKQKQKQNVKQSVVVKIGGDILKKRRAYKPRIKKEIMQPLVNVSYIPLQQDQGKYTELKQQLKALQSEKQNEIIKKSEAIKEEEKKIKEVREQQQREYSQQIKQAEKPKMVEQGTQKNIKIKKAEQGTQTIEKPKEIKKLEAIRERQQREYSQIIKRPERAIEQSEVLLAKPPKSLSSPVATPVEKYKSEMATGPMVETIEALMSKRGRPKSNIPKEERQKKYAETQRLKREKEKTEMKQMIQEVATQPKVKRESKKKFKISNEPIQELGSVSKGEYEQALGGGEKEGDY